MIDNWLKSTTVITKRESLRALVDEALGELCFQGERQKFNDMIPFLAAIKNTSSNMVFVDGTFSFPGSLHESLRKMKKATAGRNTSYILCVGVVNKGVLASALEFGIAKVLLEKQTSGPQLAFQIKSLVQQNAVPKPMMELLLALEKAEVDGDWKKTSALIAQLYEHFPDNQRVRIAYAEQAFRDGKLGDAETIASGILKEQPLYIRASSLLARIHFSRGENEAALRILEMAETHEAECAEMGVIAGDVHMRMGEPVKAADAYARARKFDPESKEAALGELKANIASDKPQGDVLAALVSTASTVAAGAPGAAPASTEELGLILSAAASDMSKSGKIPEAIRLYEGALRFISEPQRQNKVRFNLALAFFKCDRLEESLDHSNLILESDPGFTKASDLVGVIIEKQKQKAAT